MRRVRDEYKTLPLRDIEHIERSSALRVSEAIWLGVVGFFLVATVVVVILAFVSGGGR